MGAPSWRQLLGCAVPVVSTWLAVTWLVYRSRADKWEGLVGITGAPAFLLFLVIAFLFPLALIALMRKATFRLVCALPPCSVLLVACVISLPWLACDFLVALADGYHQLPAVVAKIGSVGFKLGVLFGALDAAKFVWSGGRSRHEG